jgi:phosphate transport system permease protein
MTGNATGRDLHPRRRRQWGEEGIRGVLGLSALFSVAVTVGILVVLLTEAAAFFRHVPLHQFLGGLRWSPVIEPRAYGVLPLLVGTLHIVVGSSLIAVPVGVGTALYLSEYADERLRSLVKPVLEVLAGIPSVVYGFFALTAITPLLKTVLGQIGLRVEVFNSLSASIVVGVMVLPTVASLCDDAFRAVPRALREGAYAVGATKLEVSVRVVLPAALSGVLAAFVLAVSRAIGETMAVTLAAGMRPHITLNPLESIQTMTAFIVQLSMGDVPHGSIGYQTIFAVGLLLFVITLGMNLVAHIVLKRFREEYD